MKNPSGFKHLFAHTHTHTHTHTHVHIYIYRYLIIYNLQLFPGMRQALFSSILSANRMTVQQKRRQPGNPQDSPPTDVAAWAQRLQGTCRFPQGIKGWQLGHGHGWPWGSDWWVLKLISYITTHTHIYIYICIYIYTYIYIYIHIYN